MAQIPKLKTNKKYLDAPRYKLIYDYEGQFKKAYQENINQTLSLLGQKIGEFSK